MCTHDLCFEQKVEKYHNFSFENNHFYSREILQYIVWACFRNVVNCHSVERIRSLLCDESSYFSIERSVVGTYKQLLTEAHVYQ